jgi:hypothetical protein
MLERELTQELRPLMVLQLRVGKEGGRMRGQTGARLLYQIYQIGSIRGTI